MPRFALYALHLVVLSALVSVTGCGTSRRGGETRGRGGDSGSALADTGPGDVDGGVTDLDGGVTDLDGGEDPPPDTSVTRTCDADFVECDGACVDLYDDVDHCGSCGNYCAAGEYCEGGDCIDPGPTCASPRTLCGESCVDTGSSRDHCGGCFRGCEGDDACRAGSCVSTCTPSCGGASCGDDGCGGSCGSCGASETCVGVVCLPSPTSGGGESCGTAAPIGTSATFAFTGHVADHTPLGCSGVSVGPDVAFVYTSPATGDVTVTSGNAGGTDTVLAVFEAVTCDYANEVACNDDSPRGGVGSEVTFHATSGQRYYLVVAPYGGSAPPTDTITVTVRHSAVP